MSTRRDISIIFTAAVIIAISVKSAKADANSPDINGLAHICVYTKDIAKSLVFYTDTLGFELIHNYHPVSGKNSTDIQLTIDAMEYAMRLNDVNWFVLATGDSDFSPLFRRLRVSPLFLDPHPRPCGARHLLR